MIHFKNIVCLLMLISGVVSNAKSDEISGSIAGKILDKKTGESLPGVVVVLPGTSYGAVTDFEGKYTIPNVSPGKYNLQVTYVSYVKKLISDVEVKPRELLTIDVILEPVTKQLNEVVVKTEMKKESAMVLLIQQKTSASVSSGVSAELIRKTPDRTTADVMKRISGASIQDNKFAIVRGLSDRYNMGFLNGSPLPSTESDRKAFSMDVIPASVIDQMSIIKSASPDLPGDFAGGIIQITTKDIPDENSLSVNAGTGYHSITTFRNGLSSQGSGTDWLGYDNGARHLPSGLMNSEDYKNATFTQMGEQSKLFNNNFSPSAVNTLRPNMNLQITGSKKMKLFNNDFGIIAAISYSNNMKYVPFSSTEADGIGNNQQSFDTSKAEGKFKKYESYQNSVIMGGVLNMAYKVGKHSKFSLKNIMTMNSDDQVIRRTGVAYTDGRLNPDGSTNTTGKQYTNDDYFFYYRSSRMYSSQFNAEHLLSQKSKIRVKYTLAYTNIHRDVPDYRRLLYSSFKTNADTAFSAPQASVGTNTGGAYDPAQSGRYFSTLDEQMLSASYEIAVPFNVPFLTRSEFKVGGMNTSRSRTFNGRNFIYAESDLYKDPSKDYIKTLGAGQIFANSHLDSTALYLTETTLGSDMYTASSRTDAVFGMLDIKPVSRLRIIGGVRFERFNQKLNSESLGKPVKVDTTYNDLLPSINILYELTDKANLRAGFSKTVSRPEFREYAPLAFYEINLDAVIKGNEALVRSQIYNYDLKWEYFPTASQLISVNPFFKYFINPVEATRVIGTGRRTFTYLNAPSATNFGIELETRLNLGTYLKNPFWQQFSVLANFAWIQSLVKLSPDTSNADQVTNRPLQGQSPYVFNAGIQYSNTKQNYDVTVTLNRIGRRIAYVGPTNHDLIWEDSRTVVDASISKTIKKKLIMKLTIGDILAQPLVFYQDLNKNGKFDQGTDVENYRYKYGFTLSFSAGYTF